jgi:hypothetical protein
MTDVRTAGVLAALCLLGAASGEAQRVKPDELLARTGAIPPFSGSDD